MNLLESLLSGNNASSLRGAGSSLGLGDQQTKALVENLVPVLARGVQRSSADGDGLAALSRVLEGGQHERLLGDATELAGAGRDEGNRILGQVLGDKQVSRNLANHAAQQTGVDYDTVKKFLPVIAAAIMGSLSQQNRAAGGGLTQGIPRASAATTDNPLAAFLDADRDGSIADDLLGLASKFLR